MTEQLTQAQAQAQVRFFMRAVVLYVLLLVFNGGLYWFAGQSATPVAGATAPPSRPASSSETSGARRTSVVNKGVLTPHDIWEWREDARDMFYHAYDAYMAHGYPWDEVKPLACVGRRWDMRERGTLDDSLGGFSLTLVDSLDMLAIVGDYTEFRRAVRRVVREVTFDRDVVVSVFETNIRVLGGLLSAHALASDPALGIMPTYDGSLLRMALDVGWRLLPAFQTPTGLPFHRVNLRHGVPVAESAETCTAAAGTYLLEFGLLSRMTGVPEFEAAARRALDALWSRRSALNMVGSTLDVKLGHWRNPSAGVGAGIDSFYEYLFKGYMLLDDEQLLRRYRAARNAVTRYMEFDGVHVETNMHSGGAAVRQPFISALQAFWPGLDATAGQVEEAVDQFRPLKALWNTFSAIPEMFELGSRKPVHYAKDAPLRPELIESAYMLYTATGHESFLRAGAEMMEALNRISKVRCGYASIADVLTHRLDDRMDSYMLSETAKYLFLLFDSALLPGDNSRARLFYPNASSPTPTSHLYPLPPAVRNGSVSAESGLIQRREPDGTAQMGVTADGDVEQLPAGDAAGGGAAAGSPGGEQRCDPSHPEKCRPALRAAANTTTPASKPGAANPSASHDVYAAWMALPDHHRLAETVRSGRSDVAALPFSSGRSVFTTEGHMFLLSPRLLEQAPMPESTRFGGRPRSRVSRRDDAADPVSTDIAGVPEPELYQSDFECPDPLLLPSHKLSGTPKHDLNTYVRRTREGALLHQQSTASKNKKSSKKKNNNNNKGADQPGGGAAAAQSSSMISATVTSEGAFDVADWTREVVFSRGLLQVALNRDAQNLAAAGVESIVINCESHRCFAITSIASNRRIGLAVAPVALDGTINHAAEVTFDGCSAQFGPVLSRNGIHDGWLAMALPLSGCSPVTQLRLHPLAPPDAKPVVLVTRGECSFVTKARNVQQAGGAAVVVVDTGASQWPPKPVHDEGVGGDTCPEDDQTEADAGTSDTEAATEAGADSAAEPVEVLNPLEFSMADDGTGTDILIPATLVAGTSLGNVSVHSPFFASPPPAGTLRTALPCFVCASSRPTSMECSGGEQAGLPCDPQTALNSMVRHEAEETDRMLSVLPARVRMYDPDGASGTGTVARAPGGDDGTFVERPTDAIARILTEVLSMDLSGGGGGGAGGAGGAGGGGGGGGAP